MNTWGYLLILATILGFAVVIVPLFETKEERAQNDAAQADSQNRAVDAALLARVYGGVPDGVSRGPDRLQVPKTAPDRPEYRKDGNTR